MEVLKLHPNECGSGLDVAASEDLP